MVRNSKVKIIVNREILQDVRSLFRKQNHKGLEKHERNQDRLASASSDNKMEHLLITNCINWMTRKMLQILLFGVYLCLDMELGQ